MDGGRLGENAVFLAYVMNVLQDGVSEDSYWLLVLDRTGATKMEKIIPVPDKHYVRADRLHLAVLKNEGVVIASQDNVETQLFKVSPQGKVTAKAQFKGCPPIMKSSGQDAIIQFCFFDNGCPTLRTYDKDLKKVGDITLKKWPASEFFPTSIHRMADGSYMFAASDHGQPFVAYAKDAASDILKVSIGDNDTDARQDMVPYVRAAAPTGRPGEFVVAPDVKSHPILFIQAPIAPLTSTLK